MFLKMGQFILVSGALMGKMMPPATNQTWLAGKSPTKMEQYTGENHPTQWMVFPPCLIPGGRVGQTQLHKITRYIPVLFTTISP